MAQAVVAQAGKDVAKEVPKRVVRMAYWRSLLIEAEKFRCQSSDPINHVWRPPSEDRALLSRVAKAARTPEHQLIVRSPARFVYNEAEELPVRLQVQPPIVDFERWGSANWLRCNPVHKDFTKYYIHEVMQDVYEHVKGRDYDLPAAFARCSTERKMLETYEMLGSLSHYPDGLCFVKTPKVAAVVIDSFVITLRNVNDLLCKVARDGLYRYSKIWMSEMRLTGSSMVTIPKQAATSYKVITDEQNPHALYELPETWTEKPKEVGVEVPPEFGGEAAVKVAVEIDRTVLGMGNLIFFEPLNVADDQHKVWERLQALMECEGLKISRLQIPANSWRAETWGPRVYVMVPEFMDPDKHLPFYYEDTSRKSFVQDYEPFLVDNVRFPELGEEP